jgi:hypothetical protein
MPNYLSVRLANQGGLVPNPPDSSPAAPFRDPDKATVGSAHANPPS